MKIAHIISGLDLGGAELCLYNIIKAWPSAIDTHIVFTFRDGPVAERLQKLGIPVIKISLFKNFAQESFDIVISHLWKANIYARFWCAINRIPLISVWHNNAALLSLFKRILDKATAFVFPGTCVAVAQSVAQSYAGVKSIVIENGIDYSLIQEAKKHVFLRQRFNIPSRAFVFGAVGRLETVKAYDNLIVAFTQFCEQGSFNNGQYPYLVLVGDGSEYVRLQKIAMSSSLASYIIFAGRQEDVAACYYDFNVYVSSSESEGLSLALLEALACGLPVMVTRGSQAHLLFTNERLGVVAQSHLVSDLVIGLQLLYNKFSELRNYNDERKDLIRTNFSVERMALSYKKLAEQCLN